MEANQLLENLLTLTHQIKQEVLNLELLSDTDLNTRPQPASWSILECIEHLNRYGHFYIPEIAIKISTSPYHSPSPTFKSGYFGNYFAKRLLPKVKLNKRKTPRAMNPSNSKLNRSVLTIFIQQQNSLIALLEQAKTIDLNRTKTSTLFGSWVKLRLGDTLKIVVFHNLRHLEQIKSIVHQQKTERLNYFY